mgnify:CR=1 FL=1
MEQGAFELYNLSQDPKETTNLVNEHLEPAAQMMKKFDAWNQSTEASIAGKDYPEGLLELDPEPVSWTELPQYQRFFDQWKSRPEYRSRLKKWNP